MSLQANANESGPEAMHLSPQERRAARLSLACVLAVGSVFVIAAPQPEPDNKLGATRASAVPTGAAISRAPTPKTEAQTDVKIIGGSADVAKPCDEQTWPYIERRCLTWADAKIAKDNNIAQAPLGLRDVLAGVWPVKKIPAVSAMAAPATDQPVGSVSAIAPTPPKERIQASTIGAAARDDEDLEGMDAAVPPSRAEQRRMAREQRRMRREERRIERAERRAARNRSEYSNRDGDGEARRLVVIRHGSQSDRFFRNFR